MVSQSRNSYMEAEFTAPPLGELGKMRQNDMEEDGEEADKEDEEIDEGSSHAYVEKLIHNLLKETKEKSKAWMCRPVGDHMELAYKKVLASSILMAHTGLERVL